MEDYSFKKSGRDVPTVSCSNVLAPLRYLTEDDDDTGLQDYLDRFRLLKTPEGAYILHEMAKRVSHRGMANTCS